jgi:hypothetical protein
MYLRQKITWRSSKEFELRCGESTKGGRKVEQQPRKKGMRCSRRRTLEEQEEKKIQETVTSAHHRDRHLAVSREGEGKGRDNSKRCSMDTRS